MSDIIESMAKAICCPSGLCRCSEPDRRYIFQRPCYSGSYRAEATAALAAALAHLEKPTQQMIGAGHDVDYREGELGTPVAAIFTAMIRAAK